jgi:hypothetical protein
VQLARLGEPTDAFTRRRRVLWERTIRDASGKVTTSLPRIEKTDASFEQCLRGTGSWQTSSAATRTAPGTVIRPDVLILDDFAMRQLTTARPTTFTSWLPW